MVAQWTCSLSRVPGLVGRDSVADFLCLSNVLLWRFQTNQLGEYEAREIRTPNLLIWSQTRCRCAIAPMALQWSQGLVE